MITLSIRIDKAQEKEIGSFAEKMAIDKSAATRIIIQEGLKVIKTHYALENIRLRKWTLWKAAEYCGESLRGIISLLRRENIPFPLTSDELEIELNEDRGQ